MTIVNEITPERLRELAEVRGEHGKVLSLYINLDPTTFGTRPARASEINAVLDEADRTVRDDDRLERYERSGLSADLERAREALMSDLDFDGARGLAVFSGKDLFELVRLPRPVAHHVAIGDAPYLEPLAELNAGELWWVVLVDRRRARLLSGTPDGLVEVWRNDDEIHGQHDQGGWSQANYQRSVSKEAEDHLRHVADELARRVRRTRIDGILLGGPHETVTNFVSFLHPDVGRHLAGQFEVEVWTSTANEVRQAAQPVFEDMRRMRDEELLARLAEELGTGGRAVAGLVNTLAAVYERRIEILLVEHGLTAAGGRCPKCGWLGTTGKACPADGTATEPVANVVDAAIHETLLQAGRVRALERNADNGDRPLAPHGGIAALTRF